MTNPHRIGPVVVGRDARVDEPVAREVAAAYLDARDRPAPLAVTAFSQLVKESDRLFRLITRPTRPSPLRVFFTTCKTPYRDAQELIASVTDSRSLEVTTVAVDSDRRHPVMGNEPGGAYDRFRAVHDLLGHARMDLDFDRDCEFAVWLAQERFHSPLARWALGTELHGQHSVRWTTGQIVEPKAILLEPALASCSQEGVPVMNDPCPNQGDDQLEFLRVLVDENASIAGDVVQVTANLWAIHGFIPVDGDVLMAEFDSYDLATNVLGELDRRTRRRDEI